MRTVAPTGTLHVPRFPSFLRLAIALLALGLLAGASEIVVAQTVDAVTVEQPKVIPGQFTGDLSKLPRVMSAVGAPPADRPLLRPPYQNKTSTANSVAPPAAQPQAGAIAMKPMGGPSAPMPSPTLNFAGLGFNDACPAGGGTPCGAGWPPAANGDVGPNHYIQAVNDAFGIYNKTGTLLASFTENQLWSGVGSTPCNGNSQGDPVVVYDWLADRFVLTWFAFGYSGGNPVSPFYQCIAASKTGDPVAGGWWMYAVRMDPGGSGQPPVGDVNDYGKFGLWHDCLYMASNEYRYPTSAAVYDGTAFASFSRADLYSGAPLTYSLGYLPVAGNPNVFGLIPSNNQGKGANAAQPGTPNYFVSESGNHLEFEVRKFTAGPNCGAGGTLSAPTIVNHAAYTFPQFATVPQPNTSTKLDVIDDRLMQKVQYRKIGGTESLWVTHAVGASADPSGQTAMQWAQLDVTGGTISTAPVQQQIYAPDATLYRFMGSLAVDKQGNMALGYTTSNGNAPNYPSIAYSGRLATDPPNTLPQTEVQLIAGGGSQNNTCGGVPCDRWGDYSSMSVDPANDCTFWYTNEYYDSQANGNSGNWKTRIGAFSFPSCIGLPATLTVSGGSTQSTRVGTAFPQPLVVLVKDGLGNPMSGVTVTWTAPASAASATFSAPASTTNGSGLATIGVIANSIFGSYVATAHVGTLSIDFNLTNAISIAPGTSCGGNAATNADLVEHYYASILNRPSEPAGKASWISESDRLCGLGADVQQTFIIIANVFFNAPEYLARNRTDIEFVTDLYSTFFGRMPDSGGYSFWVDQLAQGNPRNNVMSSFLLSPEFRQTMSSVFRNPPARAETYLVLNLYGGLLRRLAETGGYTYWTALFRAAQCGANPTQAVTAAVDSISGQFVTSAEYTARNATNGQFVEDIYYALLQRGAELAGYGYWVGQLNGSVFTRAQERQQFLAGPEMQQVSAAIAAQGCLH